MHDAMTQKIFDSTCFLEKLKQFMTHEKVPFNVDYDIVQYEYGSKRYWIEVPIQCQSHDESTKIESSKFNTVLLFTIRKFLMNYIVEHNFTYVENNKLIGCIITSDTDNDKISDDNGLINNDSVSQKSKTSDNITDKLYSSVTNPKIQQKTENTEVKPIKKTKAKIPQAVRTACWDKWIGREKGVAKCLCCNINEISQSNFACGHVVSDHNGGEITVENLKPVCTSCNSSMGTKNMDQFVKTHKLN